MVSLEEKVYINQNVLGNEKFAERRDKNEWIEGEGISSRKSENVPAGNGNGKGNCNDPNHSGVEEKIKELNEKVGDLQLMLGEPGTPEEIQKKIKELLDKTKQEWTEYLNLTEKEQKKEKNLLLFLAWEGDPKKKEKAQKILDLIDQNSDTSLEGYKKLAESWNEESEGLNIENEAGGALFTLKSYLKVWENPPKPALTPDQEEKLSNYDKIKKERDDYEKENKNLRNREPTANERKIIAVLAETIPTGGLTSRLDEIKGRLNKLKKYDLTVQGNPNFSTRKVSLPQRLAESFEQFIWICEFYFDKTNKLNKEIEKLKEKSKN